MDKKTYDLVLEEINRYHRSEYTLYDFEHLLPLDRPLEEIEGEIRSLGVDFNYIRYTGFDFIPFQYVKDFSVIDLFSLEKKQLEMYDIQRVSKKQIDYSFNLLRSGQYSQLFSMMDKRIKMPIFQIMHKYIPKEKRYGIFRTIYASMEYNFADIDPEFLEVCFQDRLHSSEHHAAMEELKTKTDGEYITIYRGECSKSTPKEEALSWTLDRKVAEFFANRFSGGGFVHQASVPIDSVLDYITHRNEEEILVFPEHVQHASDKVKQI